MRPFCGSSSTPEPPSQPGGAVPSGLPDLGLGPAQWRPAGHGVPGADAGAAPRRPPRAPPPRRVFPHPPHGARRPAPVTADLFGAAAEPVRAAVKDLLPLTFRQVRRTAEERTFNALIETHHYLGYTQPVGEHLKYLVWSRDQRLLGVWPGRRPPGTWVRGTGFWVGLKSNANGTCGCWRTTRGSSSCRGCRFHTWLRTFWGGWRGSCRWTGSGTTGTRWSSWRRSWTPRAIKARATGRRTGRFWGLTTGRGKNDLTHQANRTIEEILGYPLCRDFRQRLRS